MAEMITEKAVLPIFAGVHRLNGANISIKLSFMPFSDCKVNEKEMVRVQNRTSCHFFSLVHDILAYHYKNRKSHFLLQVE